MEERNHTKAKNIVLLIVSILIIIIAGKIISKYNYNDFEKGVKEKGATSFSRDSQVKYTKDKSYKIENYTYTDALFSKKITVKPNTPYKVTCMVKTENVQNENNISTGGAQIVIKDTVEHSESIKGTQDWTELTFMFNSKNRESVEVGFRLGGFEENSRGTAWFTDFKMEEGELDSDNNWKMVCFLIENIDVNTSIDGKPTHIKISMTDEDIQDIKNNMKRLPNTLRDLSNERMSVTCETIKIEKPLTHISYDEVNEYYIDPKDVEDLIGDYVKKNEYDYIYVAARFGNELVPNVLAHDWIGLGGMDYYGIGFSNIRLPDSENSYVYKYNSFINTFPEEVFVHEFLHTLERNEKEYGNENVAELHEYEDFGYETERLTGLKDWYAAYMQNFAQKFDGTQVGLTANAYSKPIHQSNFQYSFEIEDIKDPQNIIESIRSFIKRAIKLFNKEDERGQNESIGI